MILRINFYLLKTDNLNNKTVNY